MKRSLLVLFAFAIVVALPMFGCKGAGKTVDGGDAASSQDYKGAPPGAGTKPSGANPATEEESATPGAPASEK